VDALDVRVVIVMEGGDDEEDEIEEEPDLLHPFAAVKFVVDKECWGLLVRKSYFGVGWSLQAR
jgi:hypothetical protein